MLFKSNKVPKVSIVPFFHFLIIDLKLPVCFKRSDIYVYIFIYIYIYPGTHNYSAQDISVPGKEIAPRIFLYRVY